MAKIIISTLLIWIAIFLTFPSNAEPNYKIIIDADLHQNADDHEALVMLVNLQKQKFLEILGVTIVAGNHNLNQIEVDTLRIIERLKLEKELLVYKGADRPLLHSKETFNRFDKARYGSEYAGAWTESEVIKEPIDGMPTLKVQDKHAVNYIIDTVRENPNEVTLVALGPLTNIALAFRLAPDIIPLTKSIIYMGGSAFFHGNVTPSAEFNWWFDAEAADIVLSQEMDHLIIPLDATDKLLFNIDIYNHLVNTYPEHMMTKMYFLPKFKDVFASNPQYTIPVWDALVPAYMYAPDIVSEEKELWINVDSNRGPGYGRSIALPIRNVAEKPYFETQKAKVILSMDEIKFWDMYETLIFKLN